MSKKRIAVLMGGWNGERDVSLSSGREVVKTLINAGYEVNTIDVQKSNFDLIMSQLTPKPDVAMICTIHGKGFEDGCLQGMLELMGIPYTNSGPLASAMAMDKNISRIMLKTAGIPIAEGGFYHRSQVEQGHIMTPPYVVKPVCEGSSLGLKFVKTLDDLKDMDDTWQYGDNVIVEKYIPGREIMVLIMGDKAVGTIEVKSQNEICSYDDKYVAGQSTRLVPAPLHLQAEQDILKCALKAYQILGCEGVARVDLRYDDTSGEPGKCYVLEVNTQPGMTPTSFVPLIAAHHGISFQQLVKWMVDNPRCPS